MEKIQLNYRYQKGRFIAGKNRGLALWLQIPAPNTKVEEYIDMFGEPVAKVYEIELMPEFM